jgi:predicted GTPase
MTQPRDLDDFHEYRDDIESTASQVLEYLDEVEKGLEAVERELDVSDGETVEIERHEGAIEESLRHLEEGTFQVAFVGQMKAGKSTLVNASIFEDQVLPVASTPQTAKLTVVEQGEEPSATVHFYSTEKWSEIEERAEQERQSDADNFSYAQQVEQARERLGFGRVEELLGTTREIEIDELDEYVASYDEIDGEGQFVDVTESVTIEYPFDWGEGVEVVDTPGTNDPNEMREQVTHEYLDQADAVVMVLYGGRPANTEDIRFLREKLLNAGPSQVIIAVNKWDQVPEAQQADVESYLREALIEQVEENDELDLPDEFRRSLKTDEIYPVSAMRALLARTNKDIQSGRHYWRKVCRRKGIESLDEALEASGIEELERGIQEYLVDNKGRELLDGPLRQSRSVLEKLQSELGQFEERIETRLDNLNKRLDELEDELASKRDEFDSMGDELDELRVELRRIVEREFKGIGRDGQPKLDRFVDRTKNDAHGTIQDLGRFEASGSSKHIDDLNSNLGWKARELNRELEEMVVNAIESAERQLRGDLRDKARNHFDDYRVSPWVRERIDAVGQLDFDRYSLPSPPSIDVEEGFVSGVKTLVGLDDYKSKLKRKVNSEIKSYERSCRNYLEELPDDLAERARDHIGEILDDIRGHYEDEIEDLEREIEAKKDNQRDVEAERERLEQGLDSIDQLEARAESLADEVEAKREAIR